MEVYVLLGIYDDAGCFLGVYHTQSDAEFAREEYDRGNIPFFDYTIERRVIGARAKWEY